MVHGKLPHAKYKTQNFTLKENLQNGINFDHFSKWDFVIKIQKSTKGIFFLI